MGFRSSAAAFAVACFACHLSPPAQAAPLEAYGAYPNLEDVEISPDGTKLAYVTVAGDTRRVVVQAVGNPAPLAVVAAGDQKLRALAWAGNDTILITTSQATYLGDVPGTFGEWFTTRSFAIAEHDTHVLLARVDDSTDVTFGPPMVRSAAADALSTTRAARERSPSPMLTHGGGKLQVFVIAPYYGDDTPRKALFRIELGSNDGDKLDSHSIDARGWIVDGDGTVIAEENYNVEHSLWNLELKQDGDWRTIDSVVAPIDPPRMEGLSEDGQAYLVGAFANGRYALTAFSVATGAAVPVPVPVALGDIGGFIEDPLSHRIIGAAVNGTIQREVFFSPASQALWQLVAGAFPRAQVTLASWSEDKTKIVAHVFGPDDGDLYMLVDLTAKRADAIGPAYKGIGRADIAPVTAITYTAADGMTIPAYLTLPRDRPAKALPLIVFPHGGPAVRDEYGFDWWAQAMASRGYAVLQPEFRGSDGYGGEFLAAGFGQFGRKMQSDLSDGVRALAAAGTIDPRRVCIVGASYGGYAALAGATLDAGVYRCAVSVAGVSDLHLMLAGTKPHSVEPESPATRYWLRFIGAQSVDDPLLLTFSPITYADKVTIPILLVHGSLDTVVSEAQSTRMADALKKAGKDVSFVELGSEDHWLSRAVTRTQMLEAVVGFVEKNNPP